MHRPKESSGPLSYHPSKVSWATIEFTREPPSSIAVSIVYVLLGLLAVSIAYCYFTKVPVSITAAGVLVSEVAAVPVVSTTGANVTMLRVRENQTVRKGDRLVETDLMIPAKDYNKLLSDLSAIRKQVAVEQRGKCGKQCQAQFVQMADGAFNIEAKGSLRSIITEYKDILNQYVADLSALNNISTLTAEQVRQIQVARQKLAIIKSRKSETLLATEVEQLRMSVGNMQTQIAEKRSQLRRALDASRNRLRVRLDSFRQSVDEVLSKQVIVAPIDGVVRNLTVNAEGQLISPGERLLELIPTNSPLIAEIKITDADISRISEGMEALLKLEALPERDFGSVRGKVYSIPVAAEESKGGSFYLIRLKMDKQELSKDGKTYPFKLGMNFRAVLIAKRERILVLGLKKILQVKDDFGA